MIEESDPVEKKVWIMPPGNKPRAVGKENVEWAFEGGIQISNYNRNQLQKPGLW